MPLVIWKCLQVFFSPISSTFLSDIKCYVMLYAWALLNPPQELVIPTGSKPDQYTKHNTGIFCIETDQNSYLHGKLCINNKCRVLANSLGSVGKMLMSLESRECTARRTLVLPQVMQAAMPRCRGLKWARMAGDCSTVSRKLRISSPVQILEKLAWVGCSYNTAKNTWSEVNRSV